jgi:hypothetical protein
MPKKLLGTKLLQVDGTQFYVGGFGMLVVENEYLVFNACTLMALGPCSYQDVVVDGVDCLMFEFEANDLVIVNLTVPVYSTLGYDITKELSKKAASIPWYTEGDILQVPMTLGEFTGIATPVLPYLNIYISYLMRDPDDLTTPYRLSPRKKPPTMISLNSVGLTVPNTLNALGGSYMDDALQSKLVNMSERSSPIEEILI